MSNHAFPPLINIDDPSGIHVRASATGDGVAARIGDDGREGLLLFTSDAARDLIAKVSAALEDAPGTSKPAGAA